MRATAAVAHVRSVVGVKRVGIALALLAACAALVTPAGAAPTDPGARQREIDQEVRRLRDQLDEASDQQAELLAELNVTQRLRRRLDDKVAELDAAIAAAETQLNQLNVELAAAVAAADAAVEALAAARRQLDESSALLREQAVQAFIHLGATPTVDRMLAQVATDEPSARAATYVRVVAERQAQVVADHRKLQEDTTILEADAARAKAAVAARRQDLVARKAALEGSRADQAAAAEEAAAEAATEQRLLGQVRAKRSEYLRQIGQLERESNEIASLLRRRQANERVTPSGRGVLGYPVASPVVTSSFGYRVHPIYGDSRLHAGIDLRAGTGTSVLSAEDGEVVFAGWKSGYGNTVIIDHGGSLATLYAHNSALEVGVGETVRRGQLVARAGSTGNSTGPHVHFEVRVHGTPVNPFAYL
jgi:murein DD-endopeptidase MepM/ murein hydrolase activator NlpD